MAAMDGRSGWPRWMAAMDGQVKTRHPVTLVSAAAGSITGGFLVGTAINNDRLGNQFWPPAQIYDLNSR